MRLTYLGKTGPPHTDDGFRLRSNTHRATTSSFELFELKESLETLPCPLNNGDIGCYWVRVNVPNHVFDYIGQCAEEKHGMTKRLTSHFRKLCAIPARTDFKWNKEIRGVSTTELFEKASEKLASLGVGDLSDPKSLFFEKYVTIKYIVVPPSATAYKKIHRIEGMAMARYELEYGRFPNLNARDETIGLKGFLE